MAPVPARTLEDYERNRTMTNAMHATIRMTIPFIFTLDAIEQIPAFGVLIGAVLDIYKLALFAGAGLMTSAIPPLIGLIPVPLAGTVGIIIGWFMSVGLLMTYAAISLSRREFTDTLKAMLAMVPVMGMLLANTMQSVVTAGTKMANRYEKLKYQIRQLWHTTTGVISRATNAATINTIVTPGAAENVAKGMMNLTNVMKNQVAAAATGVPLAVPTIAETPASAPPASAPPASAPPGYPPSGYPTPPPASARPASAPPGYPVPPPASARPASAPPGYPVPPPASARPASAPPASAPTKVKAAAPPAPKGKKLGGKRFTRRKHIQRKWPKTARARRQSRKH